MEGMQSVFNQSYSNIEMIVADDASTDDSQTILKNTILDKPGIRAIFHDSNRGYTATFNEAFKHAKGKYVIDFALDDVMSTDFISKSISKLEQVGEDYGVSFSNADYIDSDSKTIGNHNELLRAKDLIEEIPSGDLFELILKRYFICTPSMVIRKSVLDKLEGYDATLEYEDFDFWIRSSRFTGYTYIDEVLVNKRKLRHSMSSQQYNYRQNSQLESTLKVCKKALHLCKSKNEHDALSVRINYELRHCLTSGAFELGYEFFTLLKSLKENPFRLFVYKTLLDFRLDYRFLNKKRKTNSF